MLLLFAPPPFIFFPPAQGKEAKKVWQAPAQRGHYKVKRQRCWKEALARDLKKRGNLANTGSTFKKIRASGKKIQATTTNFNKRQPKALPRLSLCVFFFWKGTQKKETKKKKEWVLIWLCKCKQDFLPTGSRFSLWPVLLANLPFKTNSPGEAAPPLLNGIIMIY